MLYMAASLSLTAGGLMLAYLLLHVADVELAGRTMNQVLTENFMTDLGLGDSWTGTGFLLATIISEGTLLIVAARPASSTVHACWRTWLTTRGCPTGLLTFPIGWPRTTASC